jgi:hypothetical protein
MPRVIEFPNADVNAMKMSIYPSMNSVTEAISFIESQVPVQSKNEMFSLLMMFHNTLLKELTNVPQQQVNQ